MAKAMKSTRLMMMTICRKSCEGESISNQRKRKKRDEDHCTFFADYYDDVDRLCTSRRGLDARDGTHQLDGIQGHCSLKSYDRTFADGHARAARRNQQRRRQHGAFRNGTNDRPSHVCNTHSEASLL